ncbi:MAG: hypothetical protein JNN33_18715, partial [Rhodospirillaceae bacterium]|nr:hypothetical protein [Rhodospirillaceae bacterium]
MIAISRRLFLATTAALVPAAALAPAALAHHGWGGYDTAKSFTLTGEITKSTYEYPHRAIEMQVEGKLWHFVLAPPSRMQRRGVTAEMIAPGKTCTVFGYPHMSKP